MSRYTVVPAAQTQDFLAASNWNMFIRDNWAASVPDLFEAAGDLAVATGANTMTRLSVGMFNRGLRYDGVDATHWDNPDPARVELDVGTYPLITPDKAVIVPFDVTVFDPSARITRTTSDCVYTARKSAAYWICARLRIAFNGASASAGDYVEMFVQYGDTPLTLRRFYFQTTVANCFWRATLVGSVVLYLAPETPVRLGAYHTLSADIRLEGVLRNTCWMTVHRLKR